MIFIGLGVKYEYTGSCQIEKNSEHELFQEKSCTARNDMFIFLINTHMQNIAIGEKVVTFERRPEFAGIPLTNEEITSHLEEAGQFGFQISIIFSNLGESKQYSK